MRPADQQVQRAGRASATIRIVLVDCAVYHEGRMVVDLWGGYRDREALTPWEEDTLVLVFSATKGISALTVALAHSRGLIDYEEKVATYWLEFT